MNKISRRVMQLKESLEENKVSDVGLLKFVHQFAEIDLYIEIIGR